MFATGGLAFQISQGTYITSFTLDHIFIISFRSAPVCIFGGLGFGVVYGYLAKIIPEKGDAYVV